MYTISYFIYKNIKKEAFYTLLYITGDAPIPNGIAIKYQIIKITIHIAKLPNE